MPKQAYKVFQFHGGLNNDADPKDIAENELANLQNVAVDKLGRIVVLGDINTEYKTIASSPSISTVGGGVMTAATDYDGFLSGAADAPGQTYWLVEKSGAITGLGEDTEDGTITVGSLAGAAMYWVDGALRIYSSDHTVAVTPQWRGYIPAVMYGTDVSNTSIEDFESAGHGKGNIWNSINGLNSAKVDTWYTKDAQITGCFPKVSITTDNGFFDVGLNLIMANNRAAQGIGAGYQADTQQVQFSSAWGFANENCGTGSTPLTQDGDYLTTTAMRWGKALGFQESKNGEGTWAPNGNETYSFYCTTIYDGVQESLPQMFTMYPPATSDTTTSNHYHSVDPLDAIAFRDGSTRANLGSNLSIWFEPLIKWCDALWNATTNYVDGGTDNAVLSGIVYNFGSTAVGSTGVVDGQPVGNPRITGVKVYWSGSEDGFVDKWLLYEWDFAKGVKAFGATGGGGGSYLKSDWTSVHSAGGLSGGDDDDESYWYQHIHGKSGGSAEGFEVGGTAADSSNGLEFKHPPKFVRYDALVGHSSDDIITVDSFKTSVVANRRTYIGNVKIGGTVYADTMLKSPPNQFDKFPVEAGRVDIVINDGDEIVALFEHADRILQFKKNALYILNVSGEVEFVESEHKFKGITNPGAACKTDYGVAWANQNGCYIYDGQKVSDLLERQGSRKISLSTWNTFITGDTAGTSDDPHPNYHRIGYNPTKRQLIVKAGTDNGAAYLFDMVTSSWTYSSAMVADSDTGSSFINDPIDGKLLIFDDAAKTFDKWADIPTSAPSINITTKDIDFGSPGLKKNVYKVYITYTGGSSQDCDVQYAVDGSGSFSGGTMSADLDYTTNTTQQVVSITPSASVTNIESFQLKISGTAATTFELNDITIIYRIKGAR